MSLSLVDKIINNAISEELFPGAALGIVYNTHFVVERYYGRHSFVPWTRKIDKNSIFDLASLTKPIGTALSIALLAEKDKIDLSDSLSGFFRNCPSDKANITIFQLLSHTSGLPSWLPLYKKAPNKNDTRKYYRKYILKAKLAFEPGSNFLYSDLGFILLGFIVEIVSKKMLFDFFEKELFKLANVKFYSSKDLELVKELVVPTGFCPIRRRNILLETNDLNTALSSHTLGHAGLFSNLANLINYLRLILAIYKKRVKIEKWLDMNILDKMFRPLKKPASTTFALGFDTPSRKNSSSGTLFSKNSIGHLGYTGTSFWIDLDKEIIIIFLSNRTFPFDKREERLKMKDFRAMLHDKIMESIW